MACVVAERLNASERKTHTRTHLFTEYARGQKRIGKPIKMNRSAKKKNVNYSHAHNATLL